MVPHSYPQYMSDMNSQHHTSNHTDTTVSTVQEKNPNQSVTSYDAKGKWFAWAEIKKKSQILVGIKGLGTGWFWFEEIWIL